MLGGLGATGFDLVQNVSQHLTEVDRHHRGGGFIGSESMVIACGADRSPEEVRMEIGRPDHGAQEHQELHVRVGFIPRVEEIHPGVGRDRPVVVLATAVDAGKRFFVQQASKAMLASHLAQHVHGDHLVVGGDVGAFEGRRDLELAGRNFVVSGLDRNPEFKESVLDFGHERQDSIWNGSEIVVVELVALGRRVSLEGPAADGQIQSFTSQVEVHQEVFLFASQGGDDLIAAGSVAKELDDAGRVSVDCFDRAQKGRFLVESFAGPRNKGGWNAEGGYAVGSLEDECGAGRVPCGVATGFVGVSYSTGGERAGIGFTFNEFRSRELLNGIPVT